MQAIASRFNYKNYFLRTLATSNVAKQETSSQIKSWKKIPGPSSLPVLGQLHHYLPGGSLHNITGYEFWNKMYKKYGPIVKLRSMLMPDVVVLMDSKSMTEVFHGENSLPRRSAVLSLKYYRQYYNKTKEQSLKSAGLPHEQGETWKQLRSKLNPVFLQTNVLKLYSDAMDVVAQDMIGRFKTLRNDDGLMPANFDYEVSLWALESIGVIILGGRIHCFDINLSKNSNAYKLIQMTAQSFTSMKELDVKPSLWQYYPTKKFRNAMKTYENLETISRQLIQENMQKKKATNEPDTEKGILEKLLEIDEDIAIKTVLDSIGGGIETVTTAIIGTLYLLAMNPEKQQKLREEIISKQGKVYLKACIKESLRLRPPFNMNLRQTTKEYTILDYRIPKGINIMFCHVYTSLMDSQYPRPHEFIPERWIVDKSHPLCYRNADPFAYAPFGFGVRTCIGRRIVQMEMEIFLTRIIENFHIEWTGPPPKIVHTVVNNTVGPFGFIFKDI